MTDATGGATGDGGEAVPADAEGDDEAADEAVDEERTYAPGLSDDGILLFFAGVACLLTAGTAYSTGQPQAVVVFAALAGAPALGAFVADVVSEFVPGTGLELLVGGAALVGAGFAVPGRHYANIATLGVAAGIVGWRVYDVEVRDAER